MKYKTVCERVRPNNGIVEVFFTVRSNINDVKAQDEHILLNAQIKPDAFQVGETYWIEIVAALRN